MGLGIVAAQAVLLYLVSRRLLLGFVVGTLASRGRGWLGRLLVNLLRLPGNLLHELSHAAAYFVAGYTIRDLGTCLTDRSGRGYCQPGEPWSALHWMPLAAALASVAPLFVGACVLWAVAWSLNIDLPATDVTSEGVLSVGQHVAGDVWSFLSQLDWQAPQTYLFWYLALSIGAELAPSDVDLRRGGPVLVLATVLLVLTLYALPHMHVGPELGPTVCHLLGQGLSWLSTALFAGLVGCGVVGLAAGLVALVVGRR